MKNKILISVAGLLIIGVLIVRYLFTINLGKFKGSVEQYEAIELDRYRKGKGERIQTLSKGDSILYQYLAKNYDESKSFSERDTNYTFLYLSESVKYKVPSPKYIDCLKEKYVVETHNATHQILITRKEKELKRKYGEVFGDWFPKLKNNKLIKRIPTSQECRNYFPELDGIYYDGKSWNDFDNFLSIYAKDVKNSLKEKNKASIILAQRTNAIKNELRSIIKPYFDDKLKSNKSNLLVIEYIQKKYSSSYLGSISYTINKTSFNEHLFNSITEDAFEEQWKSNSLYTGAMPYSYCYGSRNECEDFSCSKIAVQTGMTDVLTIIKDIAGDVIRHAYISAGHRFKFDIPDGTYQVYFYSGTGWNPNKPMAKVSCGTLRGGFVSGESFSKDDYISLYSQIMTYKLIYQLNGNLRTQPSSMNETFK